MRQRPLLAGLAVLATTATLTWAAVGTAAAAPDSDRFIAVCQERVCLLVLDAKADSDGDGVTDVDENQAGTDPFDPHSYPGAPELLDWAVGGELESFERHLTEIVVLPKVAPDGSTLATALGAFDMPAKAWLFNNPGDALATIRGNGYTNILDVMAQMTRPESPARSGLPPWGGARGYALVSAGGNMSVQGSSDFGPNGGKFLAQDGLVGGHDNGDGGRTSEFTFGSGGSVTHSYDLNYADGSRDEVTEWGERTGPNSSYSHSSTTSYDSDGNKTGFTDTESSSSTDPKTGASESSTTSDTTHFDPKTGEKTGSTKTTVQTEVKNDVKTTTTATVYYDAEGNETGGDVTESEPQECPNNTCDDGYYNTEYLSPGPITGEDFARVVTRLNSSRTPGPDTGIDDAIGDAEPKSKWPLVALINEDGVVALAAGATPTFNRAQPDYDPRLQEIAGAVGTPPHDNGNGTYSWPSDNP